MCVKMIFIMNRKQDIKNLNPAYEVENPSLFRASNRKKKRKKKGNEIKR